MKLRSFAAAIALPLFLLSVSVPLSGCQDGQLTLSAREKLETASTWAHRGSMAAHGLIIGITTTCEGKTSAFCNKAMPIVALASGALTIFDKGLAVADAALANTGTPDDQLIAAVRNLIDLERDVEDYIAQIKTQSSEAPADVQALLAQMPVQATPDF